MAIPFLMALEFASLAAKVADAAIKMAEAKGEIPVQKRNEVLAQIESNRKVLDELIKAAKEREGS